MKKPSETIRERAEELQEELGKRLDLDMSGGNTSCQFKAILEFLDSQARKPCECECDFCVNFKSDEDVL